jgi:hypothetical protein
MPSHQLKEGKRRELVELAEGWGRIAAGEAYGPDGPGLDVDLAGLEEIAVEMQRALLKGFCEVATQRQARRLPEIQPCPQCGAECQVEQPVGHSPLDGKERSRPMQLRGGAFDLAEPRCYCRSCRRSFFPSADGVAD